MRGYLGIDRRRLAKTSRLNSRFLFLRQQGLTEEDARRVALILEELTEKHWRAEDERSKLL